MVWGHPEAGGEQGPEMPDGASRIVEKVEEFTIIRKNKDNAFIQSTKEMWLKTF